MVCDRGVSCSLVCIYRCSDERGKNGDGEEGSEISEVERIVEIA